MKGDNKIRNYTVAVLLGAMIFCMCVNLTGSVLSNIMADYDIPLDFGGTMTLFQYIGSVIAIILISIISDRLKKPVVLMAGYAVVALMLFGMGGYPGYLVFMFFYLILGAGLGILDVFNNAVLGDLHKQDIDTYLSILHGVCGIGATAIPIVTVIIGTGNWKTTYRIVAGVICVVIALQLIMYLSGKREIDAKKVIEKKPTDTKEQKAFLRDKRTWLVIFIMFMFGACQSGVTVWSVKYSKEVFSKANDLMCALTLSAYWFGAMICRLAMGLVPRLKKLSSRGLIIWGGLIAGVCLLAGIISNNYYGFVFGVLAFGILTGATLPRAVGLISTWYPHMTGLASSVSFIALYSAFALIPLLMGAVGAELGMTAMMIVPVIATFGSGLIGIPLPKNSK